MHITTTYFVFKSLILFTSTITVFLKVCSNRSNNERNSYFWEGLSEPSFQVLQTFCTVFPPLSLESSSLRV